jgi:hypothetical protein
MFAPIDSDFVRTPGGVMHVTRSALLLAPVALLLTACDATAPKASQRINLSATIGSAQSSLSGPARDVIVSGSGGTVRITSAQVTLSHIKLANDAACSSATDDETNDATDASDANEGPEANEPDDDNNDEHDCEPVRIDPVVVDLPLDGTTRVVLDALVPAGTYTGVRAKLENVNVAGVFTDASGTDHPFTFTSDVEAELSLEFAAPVTVDASTTNLTVDVNVASWFTDASGAVIDPTNSANQEAIEHAIRASLRAFEDDDHDGNDDHERSRPVPSD